MMQDTRCRMSGYPATARAFAETSVFDYPSSSGRRRDEQDA
jgi:hypothetical protein